MPFPIMAAAGLGASLLGGLFGGKKTSTANQEPWKPQADQLKNAFGEAQGIYNSKKGSSWYNGDLYAHIDPMTGKALTNVGDYVNGTGQQRSDMLGSSAMGGLGQQDNYYGAIGDLASRAGTDPTGANIRSAGAYADNPYLSGQIDAASRDVTRNLDESVLPSIDRAATGTGNINSSRAGVASGIAQRGAADRIGDISSNMRGQAYDRGLAMAENGRQANLDASGRAAGMYGQAYGQGMDATGRANDMTLGNYDAAVKAGQIRQNDAQGGLDAAFKQWSGNDTRANDLLKQYYSIIGDKKWGDSSSTTTPANPIGTGLGIASTLGGLGVFKGLKI